MLDEQVEDSINRLNSGDLRDRVFVVPLMANVAIGMVWPHPLDPGCSVGGYRTFFISYEQQYVAAVVDMDSDLHAFTLKTHRRRGLMLAALSNVVLPFLAATGRASQRMSYSPENHASAALIMRIAEAHPILQRGVSGDREVVTLQLSQGAVTRNALAKSLGAEALDRVTRRLFHARNVLRAAYDELTYHVRDDEEVLEDLERIAEIELDELLEAIRDLAEPRR